MTDYKPVDTLNSQWKNDKSRFGYKMLLKMGWSEEKGLGKDATGTTEHIKLKKRDTGLGLGMERTSDGAGEIGWNVTSKSFNDVLSALKEVYQKPSHDDTDNDSIDSSEKKKKKSKKDSKKSKKEKKEKKSTAIISTRIQYKKFSTAKQIANKTDEELNAVLGAGRRKSDSDSEDKKEKKSKKRKREKE